MSFANGLHKALGWIDPMSRVIDPAYSAFKPKTPAPTPGVPNQNDAANNSQALTDQMRMRRGLMANIYAGAGNQAPVSGKTQLGT
jgi:hypothetical protein